jgi:hypothetical protein
MPWREAFEHDYGFLDPRAFLAQVSDHLQNVHVGSIAQSDRLYFAEFSSSMIHRYFDWGFERRGKAAATVRSYQIWKPEVKSRDESDDGKTVPTRGSTDSCQRKTDLNSKTRTSNCCTPCTSFESQPSTIWPRSPAGPCGHCGAGS